MKRYLDKLILFFSIVFITSISIYSIIKNENKRKYKKSIILSKNNIFLNDSIVNKLLTQILHDRYLKAKDMNMLKMQKYIGSFMMFWK